MERKTIEQKCKGCCKIYQAVESEVKRGNGLYCTRECYSLSRNKGFDLICKNCNIKFYSITSKSKNSLDRNFNLVYVIIINIIILSNIL